MPHLPHCDTINYLLSRLAPEELQEIRTYMIKELLEKQDLEKYCIVVNIRCQKTAKIISSNLLEVFQAQPLTDKDIEMLEKPIQVKFTK